MDIVCLEKANQVLCKLVPCAHDVMEFFSCLRLVPMATSDFNFRASISLDLVHGWNALESKRRQLAKNLYLT